MGAVVAYVAAEDESAAAEGGAFVRECVEVSYQAVDEFIGAFVVVAEESAVLADIGAERFMSLPVVFQGVDEGLHRGFLFVIDELPDD